MMDAKENRLKGRILRQQNVWRGKLSAVTEAYQQGNCLCQGRRKFCSSEGYSKLHVPSSQSMLILSLRSRVSDRQEGKRERQVMLPLILLIKFVPLLIIFQVSFSFNLLVATCQRSPEF